MARPAQFPPAAILAAAARVAAEEGPARLTLAAVANQLGGPTGSIYHRFGSRDVLLAELWLHVVQEFQDGFCRTLAGRQARAAGLEAALFTPEFVRTRPVEARLLLVHHRDDFLRGGWPPGLTDRATRLADQMRIALREFSRRALGATGAAAVRRARFATVDVPGAAVVAHLRAGEALPAVVEDLVRDAYLAVVPAR